MPAHNRRFLGFVLSAGLTVRALQSGVLAIQPDGASSCVGRQHHFRTPGGVEFVMLVHYSTWPTTMFLRPPYSCISYIGTGNDLFRLSAP